ncbi:TPA: HNH endonuclease [Serratia marcescens]|uniref:HNH endonuclease n=2 Tax=Serratia TaxID=613 RepID=UPI000660AA8E|nr:HNH endonuclease [Serratia sp. 506_PEND]HBC7419296.1 HNH endonuclease [Serratia marcescens]
MSQKYTDAQNLFLEVHCKGKTFREITDLFNYEFGTNKRQGTMREVLRQRGLDRYVAKQFHYSEQQLTYLFANRAVGWKKLTQMFNERFGDKKTVDAIKKTMAGRGWNQKCRHGTGKGLKYIYANGKRMRLDVYVWECVNGPLPTGYGVIHLDNDVQNNQIGNLRLAPLHIKSIFIRAGGGDAPKALAPALYARIMLKNHINQLESQRTSRRRSV